MGYITSKVHVLVTVEIVHNKRMPQSFMRSTAKEAVGGFEIRGAHIEHGAYDAYIVSKATTNLPSRLKSKSKRQV